MNSLDEANRDARRVNRALSEAGFSPNATNGTWQLTDSHALSIATDSTGNSSPRLNDWLLTVWRKGGAEPTLELRRDDDGSDLFQAIADSTARVAEISKAERVQDAAAKLAAEYDSECNPNRADEVRRAFAQLPEASAARLFDIIARHF
jgi:hypothetical protein